jgi:S-adenosylmethionine hydrolase
LYISNVFAKAVTEIGNGKLLQEVGDATVSIHVKNALRPQLGTNWIEGQIIFIDHFENVVVNITKDEFEAQRKGRSFKIVFKRDEVIEKISDSYADVNEGEKLAIFNAAGYLEIAINKGNAAGLFGLERFNDKQDSSQNQYQHKQLFYQMIKVYFE